MKIKHVAYTIVISNLEPQGWAWTFSLPSIKRAYYKVAADLIMKVKREEIAKGLDKDGLKLQRISQYTYDHRVSAMGYADPDAPPLIPAYGESRTSSYMQAKVHYGGKIVLSWKYDVITGGSWGRILWYHSVGAGNLPVRNVFGISPRGQAEIMAGLAKYWTGQFTRLPEPEEFAISPGIIVPNRAFPKPKAAKNPPKAPWEIGTYQTLDAGNVLGSFGPSSAGLKSFSGFRQKVRAGGRQF